MRWGQIGNSSMCQTPTLRQENPGPRNYPQDLQGTYDFQTRNHLHPFHHQTSGQDDSNIFHQQSVTHQSTIYHTELNSGQLHCHTHDCFQKQIQDLPHNNNPVTRQRQDRNRNQNHKPNQQDWKNHKLHHQVESPNRSLPRSRLYFTASVYFFLLLLFLPSCPSGVWRGGEGRGRGIHLLAHAQHQSQAERAILEIVLYNPVENGGYVTQTYKLTGMFSQAGTSISAEGQIIQVSDVHFAAFSDWASNLARLAPNGQILDILRSVFWSF